MTSEQIKEIALANGYKEKPQDNGAYDLNPYVYDCSKALLRENNRRIYRRIALLGKKYNCRDDDSMSLLSDALVIIKAE